MTGPSHAAKEAAAVENRHLVGRAADLERFVIHAFVDIRRQGPGGKIVLVPLSADNMPGERRERTEGADIPLLCTVVDTAATGDDAGQLRDLFTVDRGIALIRFGAERVVLDSSLHG